MLPALPRPHVGNGGSMDVQQRCHLSVRHVGLCSDPEHIDLGDFSVGHLFSLGMAVPFFHLPVVLCESSQAQMSGLDTNRSVAGMQDEQITSAAVVDPVRSNMGQNRDGPGINVHAELSVPFAICAGRPVPASIGGWVSGHEPRKGFGFGQPSGSFFSTPRKWVSVSKPSTVVLTAPVSVQDEAITAGDGTDTISHIDTHLSVVPRPVDAGAGTSSVRLAADGGEASWR